MSRVSQAEDQGDTCAKSRVAENRRYLQGL